MEKADFFMIRLFFLSDLSVYLYDRMDKLSVCPTVE
jgi:hypothetical protein